MLAPLIATVAAIIIILTETGCSGIRVKKYDGPERGRQELAVIFTHYIEGSLTKVVSFDDEELPYTMTRILEVSPGRHKFAVSNSSWPNAQPGFSAFLRQNDLDPPNPYLEYAVYHLTADLKAGYTYVPVPTTKGPADALIRGICLTEEPHDSPTARVNVTGELRYPSPNAPLVGCSDLSEDADQN